ncbi:30S ribosomal protein S3 [Thermoplasmatales archaeon SW_10_69_26]|nr:MAG: 30S ribosomal protein S3 [Thermoplasmatales archaeon SW_10_69_26]
MAVERKLVQESKRRLLMREFLARESARAGFGGCEIKRTPLGLRIRLVAERPGFVIGRRGSTIQRITNELAEKFDLDDPQIEVEEAEDPDLNAQIAAQKMAEALERGWHFRRAGHSTVRRIMNSGAKGCQIILTGKLTGSRGRMEKFTAGHIKHCGEPAEEFMREGYAMAKKKLGTIGVQVKIMAPDAKLPDDVTIVDADERPASAVDIHEEYVESQAEADKALEEIEEEAPIGADEDVPDSAGPGLEEADEEADEAEEEAEEAAEEPEPEPEEAEEPTPAVGEHELTDISGVGPATAETLADEGYDVAQIADASAEDLTEVSGIGEKTAESIKEATDELVEGEP